ncbi:type II secretion system ATPase PulE [Ferrigenium kumadai]|uniref:Type II secretion system ATPase PulE n=2 Tax=Ferrigenium kumadai TaxID=1682490 RepID=A0AAN1T1I3_9PROT|nr:type II secretion system ATPase PulE [Ferrigenium kumadai]
MNIAASEKMLNAAIFTPEQIRMARAAAVSSQRRIIEVLEEQSGLDAESFAQALGNTFHYPVYSMETMHSMTPAFDILQFAEALERECIVLRDDFKRLILIIVDPFDTALQGWAEHRIMSGFSWGLAHRSDVAAYLARYEDTLLAMDSIKPADEKAVEIGEEVEDLSLRAISEDTSPVIKLVNSTVYDALKVAASDIHLESGPSGLAIKYRIDGVLTTVGSVPGLSLAEEVISRIKVISELDISERRVPQDGRFKVSVRGREVDLRVSIMPCIFGEDAVLRILDKKTLSSQLEGLRLSYLGFDELSIARMRHLASEPYGMMLVTGPTGSGKTTTLYAAISEINHGEDKIITIEDPVEYQLPGVLQIPVNEKKGLSFALGLRSILRHDPDKIMVGEIRDPETAQIAVQSALTGHLVFTTVHANNVFDVIGRFMHMGVDPYSFVSALNGILAQRLVRINCPQCTTVDQPDARLLADSGLDRQTAAAMRFRVGAGCDQCRGTGFRGRKAIAEILNLNDEIRELIIAREPLRVLREAARRNGTRFLRELALDMVGRGETTLQEINRVTFVSR